MKLCILVLAFAAVAWAYPTGEKSEPLPAVPLVITDYSSVVKDSGVHPQHDAPQESAESNESSESEESSEVKPAAPIKPIEAKPLPAAIDTKSSEEQPQPTEVAQPIIEEKKLLEKKEDEKLAEPIKEQELIKEEVKAAEEPTPELKTLTHQEEEEVPAPVALPTEIKAAAAAEDELPQNIVETANQPAAISEDTIPLTSAKREEPAEEQEHKKPAIPLLKAEESHTAPIQEKSGETGLGSGVSSDYSRKPAAGPGPEITNVEPSIVPTIHEHPAVKSHEIHAEKVEAKIEPKSALPEPTPAVEEHHEIVTDEKKTEATKTKTETIAEPAAAATTQEGRTVRDAVKEEPIKLEETQPIEIEKKNEKLESPQVKKIEVVVEVPHPIVEVAHPIAEEAKPIVEEEKPVAKSVPQPKVAEAKQVSSEESVEESIELKKEEGQPLAAEEIPKPLALPSSEDTTLVIEVEISGEKKEEEIKVPAAVAVAELPTAVS